MHFRALFSYLYDAFAIKYVLFIDGQTSSGEIILLLSVRVSDAEQSRKYAYGCISRARSESLLFFFFFLALCGTQNVQILGVCLMETHFPFYYTSRKRQSSVWLSTSMYTQKLNTQIVLSLLQVLPIIMYNFDQFILERLNFFIFQRTLAIRSL